MYFTKQEKAGSNKNGHPQDDAKPINQKAGVSQVTDTVLKCQCNQDPDTFI